MNSANGASITWSKNFILCSPLSYLGGARFLVLVGESSLGAWRLQDYTAAGYASGLV